MNAININLIQGNPLPQQAAPGSLQITLPDAPAFGLWLNQAGAQAAQFCPALPGLTPASPEQAAQQPAAGQLLQSLLAALLDTLRGILDASETGAEPDISQAVAEELAGDNASAAAGTPGKQAATAADAATGGLKQGAVLWLQDSGGQTKESAVLWLQEPETVTKESAVLWLQEPETVTKATGLLWLQDGADVVKQISDVTSASTQPDLVRVTELWSSLVEQLQQVLFEQYGLDSDVSQPQLQAGRQLQTATPWSLPLPAGGEGLAGLPAELLPWLNQGYAQLPAVAMQATAINQPVGKSLQQAQLPAVTPASIRWFSGEAEGTAPAAVITASNPLGLSAASGRIVLPDISELLVTVVPDAEAGAADDTAGIAKLPSLAAAQPQATAAVGQQFTVALYSPGAELPLLTARLTVHAAQPALGSLLPVVEAQLQPPGSSMQAAVEAVEPALTFTQAPKLAQAPIVIPVVQNWAGQPELKAIIPEAISKSQPDGIVETAPAKPIPQPTSQLQVTHEQQLQAPVALAAAEGLNPAAVTTADTAAVLGAKQALKQTLARQAVQLKAVGQAKLPASQLQADPRLDPILEPATVLPRPEANPALSLATAAESLAQPLSRRSPAYSGLEPVGPGLEANLGLSAQAGNLPAQLLQFSGREFEAKPYGGLEFRELAGRLLETATTAHSRGDGTYQASLELNPPSLGRVSVSIAVRGDNVALQLAVAGNVPREQLKASLSALQHSLEEAGLTVVELKVVTVDPDGQPARQYHGRQSPEPSGEAAETDASVPAFSLELGTPLIETTPA